MRPLEEENTALQVVEEWEIPDHGGWVDGWAHGTRDTIEA